MNTHFIKSILFAVIVVLFSSQPGRAQETSAKAPVPLRRDVQVEYYMEVAPQSIRLVLNPANGDMYYNTFEGDIYRIYERGRQEKVYTAADHGIERLQGMVFYQGNLYLSGNLDDVNGGFGTKGIVKRGVLQSSGERKWSVVAKTVEYGGAETTFNHGFNAIVVDPTGEYLLVNSGARTDHGEVQDNDGHYPGQREVPTTAVILKLPIDGQDILLTHNEEQLAPYIYARGVRNVYSMAYDGNGHLFGVSNSGDYDHPEDMFWLREGHHYGFPWIMGGVSNPQQYSDFQPDPDKWLLLQPYSFAYMQGYFYNDPEFPEKPEDLIISPSVLNVGPDANYFRNPETGEILDGDLVGQAVSTFSPHRSPLGLFFDTDSVLVEEFQGDGFVLGHSSMRRSFGGRKYGKNEGQDLMHLKLFYSATLDNYIVQVTRIVAHFNGPTDALMVGNEVYVINYAGSDGGDIWKITLPAAKPRTK